jgi:hypothetical protein
MQRKLLGIITVDFDVTGQLLTIYSAFFKYWRKKLECSEAVHTLFIDFKKNYDTVRREVLYNILIESGIPMKLIWLLKMGLQETCSRVRMGKYLSDKFPIRNDLKQGDALKPLLFNFALKYAVRKVRVNQGGLKLNGTCKLLVCSDEFSIMGGSVHAMKKNTEALLVGSEQIGLEVNADKTKYAVMSRDQNAGVNHNTKIDNTSFKTVEEFKYLRTILTY